MVNHTIVLIIASLQAPSKDIHNITCARTQTHTLAIIDAHIHTQSLYPTWLSTNLRFILSGGERITLLNSNTHVSPIWASRIHLNRAWWKDTHTHTHTFTVACTGHWLHYLFPQIGNTSCVLTHNKQRWIHQKSLKCGKYEKFNHSTE